MRRMPNNGSNARTHLSCRWSGGLRRATHTEVAKLGTNSLLRTLNAFKQAIFLCDVASRGWPVLHANAAMLERLGAVLCLPTA